jgi:tubulin-specific chaperone E
MTAEPHVGDRVLVEPKGDAALVLFVGSVAGTDGTWVGVQFDAAGRGKHDGVHEGVRYFTCPAERGAFVRPHKLRPGLTLLQALRAKYEEVCCRVDRVQRRVAPAGPPSVKLRN